MKTGVPGIPFQNFNFGWVVFLLLIGASFLFLWGCATVEPKVVTVPQIVEMSKAGTPAPDIIRTIRDSRTVYRLSASHLARLREQGVPDAVIDYMQQTYIDSVRRNQELEDWRYWTPYRDGFLYGGPPFGMGW